MTAETIVPDLPVEHAFQDASSPGEFVSPKVEGCSEKNDIDGPKRKEANGGGSGAAEIRCPVCGRRFGRRYHLKRHVEMSSCSDDPGATFPCVLCGKTFAKRAKLEAHLKAHAERKDVGGDFCCDICGKCYEGRSLLEIHRRSHSGVRPFPCPRCPMSFVSLGSLNKHSLKHEGVRRHACPHCPLRFTLKGTLTRHLNTHAERLPFECPHCGRCYAQSGSLRAHLFTHTGINGFPCHLCGRSFARKSSVRAHLLNVHRKERPHRCESCGKRYARRDDLHGHRRKCKGALPKLPNEREGQTDACESIVRNVPEGGYTDGGNRKIDEDASERSGKTARSFAAQLESFKRKLRFQSVLLNSRSRGRGFSETELSVAIEELLMVLVEEATLRKLGWPHLPTEELLDALIQRCGCVPARREVPTAERLRENCRVLFTTILDDEVAKKLFGDRETADGVLERILQLREW